MLNEKMYLSPWPYMVIDDFYDKETWEYVQNRNYLFSKYKDKAEIKTHGICFMDVEDPVIKDYFCKKLPVDYLESKFSKHRDYTRLDPMIHIKLSNRPNLFAIHDELPLKVYTALTYIQPEHNVGVIMYDQNKVFKRVITWKPNRAVVFAAIDNVTWHNFGSWDDTDRFTIDFFWTREI